MNVTAYEIAQRFIGLDEVPGQDHNPAILAMLQLDMTWPEGDEVPWCSAFVNYCCWLLRLPRSKSLMARSWLAVGQPIDLADARPGFDIVIISRGDNPPPATVLDAPGHVGFYSNTLLGGAGNKSVHLLGGNQGNAVSVQGYDASRVLGVRRLHIERDSCRG